MENIVIDNGTGIFKAGIAGDDQPKVTLQNVVGKSAGSELLYGNEALAKRNEFNLSYPMEHGVVTNWDDMEKLWKYAFGKLDVDLGNHRVVMAGLLPENREKAAEIMFETYKVPGFYIANASILVLYSSGRVSGLIVDSGDGLTTVSPVYEGYPVPEGNQSLNVGGRDLNDYLVQLLDNAIDREVARDIKEKLCYVSLDGSSSCQSTGAYRTPDGKEIKLDRQRCKVPEALFQPTFLGLNSQGITHMVHHAIDKCETDTKITLYRNIILAGGSTLFPGFDKRLRKEVSGLAPSDALRQATRVVADKKRALASWIGGSVFASQPSFNDKLCVTKQEYQESGAAALERKCPK